MERPIVEVVHRIPGRVRLSVVELPEGEAAFVPFAESLGTLSGVREVRASARTRSVLLLFQGELEPFLSELEASSLLVLRPLQPHTPMRRIATAIDALDARVTGETRGAVSLGSAAFFAFIGAGLWQARQGHFLPAGMTLLKYAVEAMAREAERERAMSQGLGASVTSK